MYDCHRITIYSQLQMFVPGHSIAAGPPSAETAGGAEDDEYSTIQPQRSRETAGGAEDDVQYSTIQPHGSRETAGGAEDDVQYSTIQPHGSRETAGAQGDDVQYASVQFKKAAQGWVYDQPAMTSKIQTLTLVFLITTVFGVLH